MIQSTKKIVACLPLFGILTACGGGSSTPDTAPIMAEEDEGEQIPNHVLISDIPYGKTAQNTLDIYQPLGNCDSKRTTVFFVHGGGFRSGDKVGSAVSDRASASNSKGFNFVSINYRLERDEPVLSPEFQALYADIVSQNAPDDPENKNAEIAALEDSVDALNFLAAHQDEYCLDVDRLAFWGSSAGATNILSLAYSMDQFGVSRPEPAVVINYWGDLRSDDHLDAMETPFLTIHADADLSIDYQAAIDLTDRATAVGVPFAFYIDVGGGHNVDTSQTVNGVSLLDLTVNFIDAHVSGGSPVYELSLIHI